MYVGVNKRNEKVEYVSVFLGFFVVQYDRATNSVVQIIQLQNLHFLKTPESLGQKVLAQQHAKQREGEDQSKRSFKKTNKNTTGKCPHSIILSISIAFVL